MCCGVMLLLLITYIYIYGQPPNHRCTLVKPCRSRTPTLVGCCKCMKPRCQVCDMLDTRKILHIPVTSSAILPGNYNCAC